MLKTKDLTKVVTLLFLGLILLNACEKEDERIEQEKVKLQQYLEDNNYTEDPTSSGLYHIVKSEGDGDSPETTDYVNFTYTGSLIDGTVFETSHEDIAMFHGIHQEDVLYGPAKFYLGTAGIVGLIEGMQMIKEGGESRLIIPSDLGFGGADLGIVPPYSTLIYDVELLDVISDPVEHEQKLLDEYILENELSEHYYPDPGIYYIENKQGTGELPEGNVGVTLNFIGTLLDGRIFDQNHDDPLTIFLGDETIIPGFIAGLKKMRKGGEATFIIPWDLAYGEDGSTNGVIPPYSTVIFHIEVIDID